MPTIQTVVRNFSRYPRDNVWENAQDLEHVAFLHPNTNKSFKLMHHQKPDGDSRPYELLVYRATRRLFKYFGMHSMGFRRIVSDYNIHQCEYIPLLNVTSTLNSLLFDTGREDFPTLMVDEIVMEVPKPLYWLRGYVIQSLHRHARIQCQEDEPFRARRVELSNRGIHFPLSLYNESHLTELTSKFQVNLQTPLNQLLPV